LYILSFTNSYLDVPYTRDNEFIIPYKQARRREDDIAIVTSALRVLLKKENNEFIVEECGISYGGMAIITKVAKNTEKFLIGKSWTDKVFEEATQILSEEFTLDIQVPGGMPHFRRALVLSFFYKFYLSVCNEVLGNVPDNLKSLLKEEKHEKFKMEQTFDYVKKGTSVGEPIMHNSGKLQVTGEATYVDDIPNAKNELFAAIVFSTIPHGKIIEIDASEALKMEHVVAFYTAKDIPGENVWGPVFEDEQIIRSEIVTSIGQIVGVIVATDESQAKIASKKVKVKYETLPAILSIAEAIKENSYITDPAVIVDGDVDKAFESGECDHIYEGDIRIGGQEHFYLETMGALAIPGENGEMLIYSSSQNLTETQKVAAHALGVPSSKVVTKVKRIGGGFGGKESRTSTISAVAAIAARDLNQPVRLILNRDSDFCFSGQRHPFYGKYKVGVKKSGKLVALDVHIFANAGYSADLSRAVLDRSVFHVDNCYKFPNIRIVGRVCKTNLPSNTAFRGFGGPQGMMICENIMDHVAKELDMKPHKFREINFYQEGDLTPFGQKLEFFR
jgi:xanthine dehydrogenase/oxidase